MVAVAYRILRNVADSEDAVQDALMRLHTAGSIKSPEGFLFRTTTRCCLDKLRADRRRKKHFVRLEFDPIDRTSKRSPAPTESSVQHATVQLLLERLTTLERAAFLMRRVLLLKYSRIAYILNKSEVNVRQIVSRATSRLNNGKRRIRPVPMTAERAAVLAAQSYLTDDQLLIEQLLSDRDELVAMYRASH